MTVGWGWVPPALLEHLQPVLTMVDETWGHAGCNCSCSWEGLTLFLVVPQCSCRHDQSLQDLLSGFCLGRVHITGRTPDQDSNDAVSHVFAQLNYQDNNGIVVPALKEVWHLGQWWNLFPSPEAELSQGTGALLWCAVELFWHDGINSW